MAHGLHVHRYRHPEFQRAATGEMLRTASTLAAALLVIALLFAGIRKAQSVGPTLPRF